MRFHLVVLSSIVASLSLANVSGMKTEVLGKQWNAASFASWLVEPDALLTPEVSNLAVQACLRASQQTTDVPAYRVMKTLISQMQSDFPAGESTLASRPYRAALSRLSDLLVRIDLIEAQSSNDFSTKCSQLMTEAIDDSRSRDTLAPLFVGRMSPRISDSLSPESKAKLARLLSHGLSPSGLTWDELRTNVCILEGYYGASHRPELWKLFATSRILASVLPSEQNEKSFVDEVKRSPKSVALIRVLNEYSSVAGKYNGPSIGMTEEESARQGVRLTGPALGSRATALMALFTTAWREGIQRFVLDQDYPAKPFALASARDVLSLMKETRKDAAAGAMLSQTELGMLTGLDSLDPWFARTASTGPEKPQIYGQNTNDYLAAANLAWLALNAETNIRQNEKIAGYRSGAIVGPLITTKVFGTANRFQAIVQEIDSALAAYRHIDPSGTYLAPCLPLLKKFNEAAQAVLGAEPGIAQVTPDDVEGLPQLTFKPVIADIGVEIDDTVGSRPEGLFRLHLATGFGREVPAVIEGLNYTLWTPSAMVLHLDKMETTSQWQLGDVRRYDPAR